MQRHVLALSKPTRHWTFTRALNTYNKDSGQPIVSIKNATFYRHYPSATADAAGTNPAIFPNLTFELASKPSNPEYWCIVGPSSSGKTTFCEILRDQHLCFPPTARSFPYLSSPNIGEKDRRLKLPSRAIQYVGFAGKYGGGIRGGSTAGAYLSARYESRREETDFSVLDYLKGNLELNPSDIESEAVGKEASLRKVIEDLELKALVDTPVGNLSNGQTRRAKIAKALLGEPDVLLLDEPFSESSLCVSSAEANHPDSGPRPTNLEDTFAFTFQSSCGPIAKDCLVAQATRSSAGLDHTRRVSRS